MKYAIKVPIGDGDWLYVMDHPELVEAIENNSEYPKDDFGVVKLYDTEAEAAEDNFKVWRGRGIIVEYSEEPTDKLTQEETNTR